MKAFFLHHFLRPRKPRNSTSYSPWRSIPTSRSSGTQDALEGTWGYAIISRGEANNKTQYTTRYGGRSCQILFRNVKFNPGSRATNSCNLSKLLAANQILVSPIIIGPCSIALSTLKVRMRSDVWSELISDEILDITLKPTLFALFSSQTPRLHNTLKWATPATNQKSIQQHQHQSRTTRAKRRRNRVLRAVLARRPGRLGTPVCLKKERITVRTSLKHINSACGITE